MQSLKPLGFAALGAVLAVAAYGNVPPPPGLKQPAAPAPPAVQAWEYTVRSVGYVDQVGEEKQLNALTADGWEVFHVAETARGGNVANELRFVLRRPKR